jgi:pilus assembly protein CpaC
MHSANRVPLALLQALLTIGWALAGASTSAQEAGPTPAGPRGDVRLLDQDERAPQIPIPVQSTVRLKMRSGRRIVEVINQRDTIVRVDRLQGDPTTLLLTTDRTPGNSRIRLTDEGGNVEEYIVVVQLRPAQIFDIELMKRLIRQATPTANVEPILGGGNSVILTGWVADARDIDIILEIAENIVRAGPPDPTTQAALAGGAGGSGTQPDAFNTTTGVRSLTQLSIVNAIRVGCSQQVQLDVVIARVARSELRQMGFSSVYSDKVSFLGNTVGGTIPFGQNQIGRGSSSLSTNGVIQTQASNADLFVGLLNPNAGFFGFLQALRQQNLAKLLAEPKLVTLSGRPATFLSGGRQAIPQTSALGITGTSFVPFGTTLTFLPIVLGNGKIYLEVQPDVSNLDAAAGFTLPGTTSIVPGRVEQSVRTSVLMEAGQTLAIGGLIQHVYQGSTSRVPVLGDLPFIGAAFRSIQFNDNEEEVVVLVTPHLVDPMDCSQLPCRLPGQETRVPDDFELFLEGILEAPRGPREVWQHHRYVPAYKNDKTYGCYPCAGNLHRGRHKFDTGAPVPGHCCEPGCCDPKCNHGGCGPAGCGPTGGGVGGCNAVPVGPLPPSSATTPLPVGAEGNVPSTLPPVVSTGAVNAGGTQ